MTANAADSRIQPAVSAYRLWYTTSDRAGPAAVRVGEHVLVDAAAVARDVVQQEVAGLGEVAAPVEQRDDLALVALDRATASGCSSIVARRNSIPYFSAKPSNWPWPSIGRPGQRREQRRHADVLVALAELLDRRSSRRGCS